MTQSDRIYLDSNATTRPLPEVVEEVARHLRETYANPGSRHEEGRRARQALEAARESIASILGAEPEEVIFTSGGTESTNLALFGAAIGDPGIILLTAGEHPATKETCLALERRGWELRELAVDRNGLLVQNQYDGLPWEQIKLATVILAHNETGIIQDVRPLAERCQQANVFFHVDAVQAAGKIPVDFHASGATSMAIGAHKFHGPRGIGALLLRKGTKLSPFLFGGHQESGRRPGTECVALACGMARALEIWHHEQERRQQALTAMRDRLQQGLREACDPVVVIGEHAPRLPNTLNIAFPGLDSEALLVALDLEGIACSVGSTCASGASQPPPVLVAMGYGEEVYRSVLRFSLSIENTPSEIDEAIRRISAVVARMRSTH
ncbi:MAG: cysteine desulfurase [Planctomycetes bacterium]|nr:cysteine desulfurase [Planctomycetota bacterium]